MELQNRLIKIIGSPFIQDQSEILTDSELLSLYDFAFKNRVALLYLSKYRRDGWDPRLEEKYQSLKKREQLTFDVISRVADKLNKFDSSNYLIFKSLKPYPATPNDTDIIWLGSKDSYKKANEYLLNNGYIFHEWAPQQKTYFDERGKNFIGKGKKGGTYYIDFYEEISTDYYAYTNKNSLKKYIIEHEINGIKVNLLAPEPELAIIMFHSVFPERTFQLEHFFVPLYYFSNNNFNLELFLEYIKHHKMNFAVKSNISLLKVIHQKYFNFIPEPVDFLINNLKNNKYEVNLFIKNRFNTPYMFSFRTFWLSFIQKSMELYSFKSLFIQLFKMLNPLFFIDVINSIKKRLSEKGVYNQE